MADKDASQKALEQVEKATDSDRAKGEDLLGSEDLKRQLREAKERARERGRTRCWGQLGMVIGEQIGCNAGLWIRKKQTNF